MGHALCRQARTSRGSLWLSLLVAALGLGCEQRQLRTEVEEAPDFGSGGAVAGCACPDVHSEPEPSRLAPPAPGATDFLSETPLIGLRGGPSCDSERPSVHPHTERPEARRVAAREEQVVHIDRSGLMRTFSVRNPAAPALLEEIELGAEPLDVRATDSGTLVVLAPTWFDVLEIDTGTVGGSSALVTLPAPGKPGRETTLRLPGVAMATRWRGEELLVALWRNGVCDGCSQQPSTVIVRIDVSRLEAPQLTGSVALPGQRRRILLTDTEAFLALPEDGFSEVSVVDTRVPELRVGRRFEVPGRVDDALRLVDSEGDLVAVGRAGEVSIVRAGSEDAEPLALGLASAWRAGLAGGTVIVAGTRPQPSLGALVAVPLRDGRAPFTLAERAMGHAVVGDRVAVWQRWDDGEGNAGVELALYDPAAGPEPLAILPDPPFDPPMRVQVPNPTTLAVTIPCRDYGACRQDDMAELRLLSVESEELSALAAYGSAGPEPLIQPGDRPRAFSTDVSLTTLIDSSASVAAELVLTPRRILRLAKSAAGLIRLTTDGPYADNLWLEIASFGAPRKTLGEVSVTGCVAAADLLLRREPGGELRRTSLQAGRRHGAW